MVETCLALLGDPQAARTKEIEEAIGVTYSAWGGKPDAENRAAQILSLACRDRKYEPRVRAAWERYRRMPKSGIPRVFDQGIPVMVALPAKNWVCFFTARTLGNLRDPASVDSLPAGPGVVFLHNELTPCWRAAASPTRAAGTPCGLWRPIIPRFRCAGRCWKRAKLGRLCFSMTRAVAC